ncbi:histamine H3 receptor-like [Babylonia areolata]|uniref:histamine H3 receptor-like n=1 Tax=Babylonia areolata TaxID=304850 RepID=UPI003FD4EA53
MTTPADTAVTVSPTSSFEEEDDDDNPSALPLPWSVIVVVCVTVAIVTAVGGNVLILLSYGRDGQLRDVHNLYLLHLAVCDLLIGAVSMPLYLIYTVLYWRWPLGVVMCKLFLVTDFTLCCMSTLIVILVAADRLALLTLGASYQGTILLWDVVRGHSVIPSDDCDVEFYENLPFVLITEIISFSVPFVSLSIINTLLYVALKKRRKPSPRSEQELAECSQLQTCSLSQNTVSDNHSRVLSLFAATSQMLSTSSRGHTMKQKPARQEKEKRGKKVAVILTGLVLALVLFWLPYSITTILLAVCQDCVDKDLYEVFNWLLWLKSCVNPFLYAYNSPRFRRNFQQLLSGALPPALKKFPW